VTPDKYDKFAARDLIIRIDCTGCAKFIESGALDYEGTLNAVMDDEIQLQKEPSPDPCTTSIQAQAKDAARWRAFIRSTGHETDFSSGPWNGVAK